MNPGIVDVALVMLIGLFVLGGIRTGLIAGMLDLATLAVSIAAALALYQPLADLLQDLLPGLSGLSGILAFVAIVLVVQALGAIIRIPVVASVRWAGYGFPPLAWLNRAFGIIPGLIHGLIVAMLVLLPFGLFSFAPNVTAAIHASRLGGPLLDTALGITADLGLEIDGDLAQDLDLIVPPPESETGVKLPFRVTNGLRPDPGDEERMLELINQERQKVSLPPLVADELLQSVARDHSEEMFRLGYFAHESPVTGSPADRLRAADIPYAVMGENLAYAPSVEVAHEGLMNSPGHRANILSPNFRRIGIGVIRSNVRGKMFSQEFRN